MVSRTIIQELGQITEIRAVTLAESLSLKFRYSWKQQIDKQLKWEDHLSRKFPIIDCTDKYRHAIKNLYLTEDLYHIKNSKNIALAVASFDSNNNVTELEIITCSSELLNYYVQLVNDSIKNIAVISDTVSMSFWYAAQHGPTYITKNINVPSLDMSLLSNYPKSTKQKLEKLATSVVPTNGKILLLHGLPGTGKTYIIRYLSNFWKNNCTFHYISDPENFFGSVNYLMTVVGTNDLQPADKYNYKENSSNSETKYNVLILEDAGSYIELNEKGVQETSLTKLLNLTDGLLGQGLNLLMIISTNKEYNKLNPAIYRAGRCIDNIEFVEFNSHEANKWFESHGRSDLITKTPMLLADMYATLANPVHMESRNLGTKINKMGF